MIGTQRADLYSCLQRRAAWLASGNKATIAQTTKEDANGYGRRI